MKRSFKSIAMALLALLCLCSCGKAGDADENSEFISSAQSAKQNSKREKERPPADAGSSSCGDGLTFTYSSSEKTLYISGSGDMWDYSPITEKTTDGTVLYSEAPWTDAVRRGGLEKIEIEDGVTHIGDFAFCFGKSVKVSSVKLPDSIRSVGDSSFFGLDKCRDIIFSENLEYVGEEAFAQMEKMTEFRLPAELRYIGDGAFRTCSSLKSFEIGSELQYFGEGALSDCPALERLAVDRGNFHYSLIDGVLYGEEDTELLWYPMWKDDISFTVPDGVDKICKSAFYGCKIETAVLPKSIRSISDNAFYGSGLSDISLPNGIRSIGQGAFRGCKLENIDIPASVELIGDKAFTNVGALSVDGENKHYSEKDGVLLDKEQTEIISVICPPKKYSVPDTVTSLGENVFFGCEFEKLTIHSEVTNIHPSAFGGATIETLEFGGSFDDWYEFGIDLEARFKFNRTSSEDIKVSGHRGTLSNVLLWRFYKDKGILVIKGYGNIPDYKGDAPWHKYASEITTIEISEGVKRIGKGSFKELYELTDISLPESITEIGDNAFSDCEKLESLSLPAKLTVIGSDAFDGCESLAEISFGGSRELWEELDIDEKDINKADIVFAEE